MRFPRNRFWICSPISNPKAISRSMPTLIDALAVLRKLKGFSEGHTHRVPPWEPLRRYTVGKTDGFCIIGSLQTRYEGVTGALQTGYLHEDFMDTFPAVYSELG